MHLFQVLWNLYELTTNNELFLYVQCVSKCVDNILNISHYEALLGIRLVNTVGHGKVIMSFPLINGGISTIFWSECSWKTFLFFKLVSLF